MNTLYKEENNYPKAFLATGIIMGIIVALCFFIVYSQPAKMDDGTGGILVNYGTTDEGSGKDILSMDEPSKAEKASKVPPTKVTPTPPSEQKPSTETSDKKVVTQDNEDAPAVANKSKKATAPVATATAKPAAKPQVVNQAALFKGTPNKGSGQGDGTTDKAGNQGSVNGTPLASNYGPGGSGGGLNLAGWQFVNSPEVKNIHRVPGVVVVDFIIDQNGNVLEAHSNRDKSRAGLDLVQACVDAIQRSKFVSKAAANGNQHGEMTFRFNVD